jgi:hypothetical protein
MCVLYVAVQYLSRLCSIRICGHVHVIYTYMFSQMTTFKQQIIVYIYLLVVKSISELCSIRICVLFLVNGHANIARSFTLFRARLTWPEARDECASSGGQLATIYDLSTIPDLYFQGWLDGYIYRLASYLPLVTAP